MADPSPQRAPTRPIELGWLLVGALEPGERDAVRLATEKLAKQLEESFPQFTWHMPLISKPESGTRGMDEPVVRLQEGVQERDARAWDFALVVTPRDLESYYKSYALAVPSRALGVAVLSLTRLWRSDSDSMELLARRITALALHLFGDLNGLWHRDEPDAVMQQPDAVDDLDRQRTFCSDERAALSAALVDVADLRLEETASPPRAFTFYVRASLERAGEITGAVVQARPWEFPLRLSRLTAAALSALFVLLITAEVWDLGTSQRPVAVGILSLVVLLATTAFILTRQKLILRRARPHLSEQAVVIHVSATLIVLLGLATTYAMLFALTLVIGTTLFDAELIARWAPATLGSSGGGPLRAMAALVSSLGLLIGSLGASFEGHNYFRHVIYADEET